jgi:hypothetical protein
MPIKTKPVIRKSVLSGGAMWASRNYLAYSTTDNLFGCEWGDGTEKYNPNWPTVKTLSGKPIHPSNIIDGKKVMKQDERDALFFVRDQLAAPHPNWPYEVNESGQRMTWRDMTLETLRAARKLLAR